MRRTPTRPAVAIAVSAAVFMASASGVFTAAQSAAPAAKAAPPSTAQRASSAAPAPAATPASAATSQLATIQQYCVGCHNDRVKTAGVSFDGLTAEGIGQRAELFEKAVRKVRGRVMPPPGARQPDGAAADSLVSWLEHSLDSTAGRAHLRDQVVLHRLNRKEYANAVRDLLAVEVDAGDLLPADDVVDGFDNIETALQVSPSFIEQYVTAARSKPVRYGTSGVGSANHLFGELLKIEGRAPQHDHPERERGGGAEGDGGDGPGELDERLSSGGAQGTPCPPPVRGRAP